MTLCPRCKMMLVADQACECRFSPSNLARIKRELTVFKRWRNISASALIVGFVAPVPLSLISLGLGAAVFGLLASAGCVLTPVMAWQTRKSRRELRAATPVLPEARLL